MIRIDGSPAGRVRVIGSLDGRMVSRLFEAISRGTVVLDLSEVEEADESAVTFIARLPKERCAIAACPGWLVPWLERYRQAADADGCPGRSDSVRNGRLQSGRVSHIRHPGPR
jgi:hypothetical protein